VSAAVLGRDTVLAPATRRQRLAPGRFALAGLALCVAASGAWYGYDWWRVGRFVESTDDAYVGGDVTAIAPHVAGFVASIAVADNEPVRAGQLLVQLDDRDYRAARDRAEAVLREHEAALATLAARMVLQRSVIRQAEADLAGRTAQAAFAAADAVRYGALAQTSAGTQQAAQRTLAADRQAQSAVDSAQAALDAARQQQAVLETGIAEARAAVAETQATLAIARLDLDYTQIRAPIDGYVGARSAQAGTFVAAGANLLSIVPAHDLWVDANFKEDQLARLHPGQTATIVADVAPGAALHGRVVSLAPATGAVFSVIPPENATGNFTKIVQRVPVRIALDGGSASLGVLRPGLSTTVSIDTRRGAP